MARLITDMLEEEGPEDEPVIPPGLLGDDETPAASPYAALLARPQEDVSPPPLLSASALPAVGGAMPRPPMGRAGPREDLAAAQAADREAQRKADFESGLDTLAFRRPMEARQVGSPNADALAKRLGLQRQGAQDERQLGLDVQNARLKEAQIANYLREKKGKAATDLGDRTAIEKALGMEEGSLANVSDKTLERLTGLRIAGENRTAAEKRAAQNRATTLEAARIAAGTKAADKLEGDVKDYSKAIPEGAASFFEQARTVEGLLDKYKGGDLPGVGPIDSRRPNWLQSDDGIEMQKNVNQMMLAYQKLVTGAGGSAEELQKIREAGADLSDERSFERGFRSLAKNYQAFLRKVQGGYRPEVIETYEKRVPEMNVPRAPVPPGLNLDAPAAGGKVRVRRKADGKLGRMDPNDPALESGKYEVLK